MALLSSGAARRVVGAVGLLGLLFVLAGTLEPYRAQLVAVACAYAIAAIAVDVSWGYGGILSFAHSVFFGAGAFGVALLVTDRQDGVVVGQQEGWGPVLLGAGFGVGLAFVLALAIGLFAFWTRRGSVLVTAVITLSASLTAVLVVSHARDLTGGDDGLAGFGMLTVTPQDWLLISALALVGVGLLCAKVLHSDFGIVVRATRDNEQRMWFLGYDVRKIKLAVFVASAVLCALAGGLYAAQVGIVSPPLFGFAFALNLVIWVGIGGRGTLVGAALGALLINIVGPEVSASHPYQWTLLIGLMFVGIVVALPAGLYPALRSAARHTTGRVVRRRGGVGRVARTIVCLPEPSASSQPRRAGEPVLSCTDVAFAHGALQVLRGVDLEIRRGELLCLVGPNGAGKSTLMSVLADGRRRVDGQITASLPNVTQHAGTAERLLVRGGIVYKFQAASLFESLSVAEALLIARQRGRWPSWWRRSRTVPLPPAAYRIAEVTGLTACADQRVEYLSHGMRQALELVVAVSLDPEIILLDEPTAGLTASERTIVGEVLRTLVDDLGLAVVLVEHDIDFVQEIADRIVVLHGGRIVMEGEVESVVQSDVVRDAYLGAGA